MVEEEFDKKKDRGANFNAFHEKENPVLFFLYRRGRKTSRCDSLSQS